MKQVLLRLINREPSKFMDFIQHLKRHQNIGAHPILQKIKNMFHWKSILTWSRCGRGEAVDLQVEALVPRDEGFLHGELLPKIP